MWLYRHLGDDDLPAMPRLSDQLGRAAAFMRKEWVLAASLTACILLASANWAMFGRLMTMPLLPLTSVALFILIIAAYSSVVRHAEALGRRLGEPLGTLVLTLSVIIIEVSSISAVMVHGDNNPTLVSDTLLAVIMIILNGMVGVSLLVGGWVHREQTYNLQGANAYMSVIIPLAVLSLILPVFTQTTPGPTQSAYQQLFLAAAAVGLYFIFLTVQTGRHREFFSTGEPSAALVEIELTAPGPSALRSTLCLVLYLAPLVYLVELLAHPIDYLIETLHAPTALGGVIIGVVVATPEALGAIKAAIGNQIQRSINISLGSVLSTIGLTIPAMLLIGQFTGRPFQLGLEHTDIVILLLTLFCSCVTFASGRTNILQGCVHTLLFAAYVLLIFRD
jgi:Ca2+:H+ antiporter